MNVISAICNIINLVEKYGRPVLHRSAGRYVNAINSVGEKFEDFVKDIFADTIKLTGKRKETQQRRCFSYLGSQNNPPDLMIRGGDAIEIKKIESLTVQLQLNSSMPEQMLKVTNPMLKQECKDAEDWKEKQLLYVVGTVKDSQLSHISMIYGTDFCADENYYQKLKDNIAQHIHSLENITLQKTKEIAHITGIDPLDKTVLRVRGMWLIENPIKYCEHIYIRPEDCQFSLMFFVNTRLWNSFANKNDLLNLAKDNNRLKITKCKLQDPNNPRLKKSGFLVSYWK